MKTSKIYEKLTFYNPSGPDLLLKHAVDKLQVRDSGDTNFEHFEVGKLTAHDRFLLERDTGCELKLEHTTDTDKRWIVRRNEKRLQFIYNPSTGEDVAGEFDENGDLYMHAHEIHDVDLITPSGVQKFIGGSANPWERVYSKQAWFNQISELTTDNGVTIDGCLIKDGKAADASKLDGSEPGVSADKIFKIPSDITQGDIFYVDGSGNVVRLAAGTSGQFLKTQGAGANPVWAAAPGGWNVTSQSANYTASDGDIVLVDASSGAVTITLPSPSSGAKVRVKKTDASTNIVTVSPSATETIDGSSSHSISKQYETYEYVSDGTNWFIF